MQVVIAIISLAIGLGIGYYYRKNIYESKIRNLEEEAKRIIDDAKKEADNIIKEAENIKKEMILQTKEELYREKKEMEEKLNEKKFELEKLESKLIKKEESLEIKEKQINQKELELKQFEIELQKEKEEIEKLKSEIMSKEEEIEKMKAGIKKKLEEIAKLTEEEAKELLKQQVIEEAKKEAYEIVKAIEEEAKEKAEKKAREIIATAIQRYSPDEVIENTVSVVYLPSDEMKGRIIGREGRNIRAFEAITGVDLIIDDTPEVVVLSCHDPIRREIAKRALEALVKDGRIHPARIEEVVRKKELEVEAHIKEVGETVTFELGISNLHPELVKLIGRLKFRTSYGQNILEHSKEVAIFCGIMAAELGLDVAFAKRIGLLHDIGKAVNHEVEGSHAIIGAELAKKYGENEKVVNAIASHHGEVEPTSIEAILLIAADTLSAARPGARREVVEAYLKRITKMEEIAMSYKGVEKAYAIQAGRELRVIVVPEEISDEEIHFLAKDIAKRLQEELTYPGNIKVHVIRETRAIEVA